MVNQDSVFRRVAEHQFTAIVVLDKCFNVEHMNSAAELLLVRSHNQLIGQAFESLFVDPLCINDVLKTAIKEGSSMSVRATRWVLHHCEPVNLDYIVSPFVVDHVWRVILEMVPTDRASRISRGEGRVDQTATSRHLVRGLAHEIKNPLGGIRGAAQLLSKELPDPELHEYTNIIIEEADRLRNLVDRLLGSHQLPAFELTNIHQVLERVCKLVKVEGGDKIHLSRDYDPSIPEFLADQSQLIQVFLNIARNALQALNEGGVDGATITFRTRTIRQFTILQRRYRIALRIDVIDNGPGIDQSLLEKIFYPMISGRASGTGLGLSIVQQFVELHQGTVECESVPGLTQFSVYLPLEASSA